MSGDHIFNLYLFLIQAAYANTDAGKLPAGCEFIARIGYDDTYFGMAVRHIESNRYIIAIRGTASLDDWKQNLRVLPSRFERVPGCSVHRGFELQWENVRESVVAALALIPNGADITIIGHSLGGAMAQIGVVDVATNFTERKFGISLFTVAAPRAGTWWFAKLAEKLVTRALRVTNNGDVVPLSPPWWLGYAHAGRHVEVSGMVEGKLHHSLEAYIDGLEKLEDLFT